MIVESNGSESCTLVGGGFVRVDVPVRVHGEVGKARVLSRYLIGGFVGRETPWPPRDEHDHRLTFRIPRELFREGEYLALEILRTDNPAGDETLWTKRYELRWVNSARMWSRPQRVRTAGIEPGLARVQRFCAF